jgi:preprotein translocase subunit SecY
MWLGEQISDKGIGNGVSLIIFIGIVLRYPQYVTETAASASAGGLSLLNLVLFIAITIGIIIGIIFMYQGQRRVPVQQARRVVGRKMFAGRSTYIPLRLNNAGVISIIFAISILLLPQQALTWLHSTDKAAWFNLFTIPGFGWTMQFPTNVAALQETIQVWFAPASTLYNIAYFLLVVIFTFFYSSIVLNTRDVADNLKKTGAFVPGIRPGQPTVDYLNKILIRLTTASAIFLGLLAVAPNVLERGLNVTTIYLGSTSLLIVVGVALDTISQIEARLAMRDYRGFIKR